MKEVKEHGFFADLKVVNNEGKDEVRKLAERTSMATKEIGLMITSIQKETQEAIDSMDIGAMDVENGTIEVNRSGKALKEILEQIHSVNLQVTHIASAAEQQSITTRKITDNIHRTNEIFEKTLNGAKKSFDEADQLANLAQGLHALVSQFKIGR